MVSWARPQFRQTPLTEGSRSIRSSRRLTDVSRRSAPEDKAEGDEDGPPSGAEEEQQAEVTDSEASEPEAGVLLPVSSAHEPSVAWRR